RRRESEAGQAVALVSAQLLGLGDAVPLADGLPQGTDGGLGNHGTVDFDHKSTVRTSVQDHRNALCDERRLDYSAASHHPRGGSMTDRRSKLGRRSVLKGLAAGTAAAAVPTILMRKASAQQEKTLRIV